MTKLVSTNYIYLNPIETDTFKEINYKFQPKLIYLLQPTNNNDSLLHVGNKTLNHIRNLLLYVFINHRNDFNVLALSNMLRKISTNQQIIDIRKKF